MNAASQSLGNEINSTPSSLANEVRRSSLLASGNIVGGAGTVNVHTQSVPIDMKAGLNNNNNNNSAMTAATVSKGAPSNNAGADTPGGNGNGMNSGRISLVDGSTTTATGMQATNQQQQQQQQQQQALQLQAQLAAMQGMQGMAGFGAAGLNPQLAAMAGMNMNPAMMNMMSNFGGGANANANGSTAGDGSSNNKTSNSAAADSSNGGTPTPNANANANKRDSAAAFMDTLNRDSFLAGAAAAAASSSSSSGDTMGAGQAGMDSMLSRSSLLAAAGGMGGMNLAAANPMMAQLMMQQQMQLMMQQQQLANASNNNGNGNGSDGNGNGNGNSMNGNGLDASNSAAGQQFPTATSAMFGPGGLGLVTPSAAAAAGMAAAAAAASQRPAKKARKSGSSSAKASAASSLSAIANATPVGAAGTTTKPKDLKWLGMLGLLKEYKAENGDCIVPRGYGPNPKLASWVAEQRKQYKLMRDGKPSNINPERVAALNELDFAWNAQEAAWARHYSDLQAYKTKFGDCLVPLSYTDRPQLGLWVKEQRRHYMLLVQGRKSHMTQARIAQLESVGFVWDSHEATWWDRFNDLKAYQAVHGNCMVPTKYQPNPRLGTWVHHQRRQYRKLKHGKTSHMTHERMEALESIGFCWTPRGGKDGNESD